MFLGKSLLLEKQTNAEVFSALTFVARTVSISGSVTVSFLLQISTHLMYFCMCPTWEILVRDSEELSSTLKDKGTVFFRVFPPIQFQVDYYCMYFQVIHKRSQVFFEKDLRQYSPSLTA